MAQLKFAQVHIVMLLALVEYFIFAIAVGRARYRYDVKAPATSGNENFERYYRVQMNTLEQLIIFIPALWSFSLFIDPNIAAVLGVIYIIGRAIFFFGYTKAANKRSLGFAISSLPMLILLIGGIIGAAIA